MKLDGRRLSNNVSDKRGQTSGKKIAGIGGIAGLIIAGIVAWISGGDLASVINQSSQFLNPDQTTEYIPTEKEQQYAEFAKKILAGTEDVWSQEFKKMGLTYTPPQLVLYTGSVSTACGNGTASVGPFYCSGDHTIYLDLSFFDQMEKEMGAGGDFAFAYVIAHEVGHHVQHLLGTLEQSHSARASNNQAEANKISVRTELQADFYAGVWAYHDNKMFGSLEEGDLEEGVNAASKIGDDYLQKQARGYSVPESFTHGTSAQRIRWLKKGFTTGNVKDGNTFSQPYNSL